MDIVERNTVFSTPWFSVVAKTLDTNKDAPYYSLQLADYVCILALTEQGEILLVRQYRPTVEDYTLELPSGLLEEGETPSETAIRELLEETGYVTDQVALLGCLVPDTGRLSNRLWCFFAENVRLAEGTRSLEPGIELVICTQEDLVRYILEQRFNHALHMASFFLAVTQGKLPRLGTKSGDRAGKD